MIELCASIATLSTTYLLANYELSYKGVLRRLTAPNGRTGLSLPPHDWLRALELFPEFRAYTVPHFGVEAEKAALTAYYKLERPERPDEFFTLMDKAVYSVSAQIPPWHAPIWQTQEKWPDVIPLHVFYEALSGITSSSHSGYPSCLLHQSKGSWLLDDVSLYNEVNARWACIKALSPLVLNGLVTPDELVYSGVGDPFFAAIKNEARKIEKDDRIIMMASIFNEILLVSLFAPFKAACQRNWGRDFYAPGFAFNPGSAKRMFSKFWVDGRPLNKNDSPKYDTSIIPEENRAFVDVAAQTCLDAQPWVWLAARTIMAVESRKVIVLSNGQTQVHNNGEGGASGVWITTLRNTIVRAIRSHVVQSHLGQRYPLSLHASDDTVETNLPGLEEAYRHLGLRIRDSEAVTTDGIEFCSHFWEEGCFPVGTRIAKSFYSLVRSGKDFEPDRFSALCSAYFNHPDLPSFAARYLHLRGGFREGGQ
jgi:hypothetical protein